MEASPLGRDHGTVPCLITEPFAPREPLPAPYELRVAALRTRSPGGDVVALGDADLLLPAGRRAALVAPSRAHTSALIAVLLRLLDYEGIVTLNDVRLRDMSGDDVRRIIGLCAPDTPVLPGTVADNVRMARPDATGEQVEDAIHRARLRLPPDAVVADRPEVLTGAERRRVGLARALLADVPILIVDEPDECADPLVELLTAVEDRTLLLITCRPVIPGGARILRHVDEVVTLSDS